MPKNAIDFIGSKYNKLTIIGISDRIHFVLCECDCGVKKDINFYSVTKGGQKSCGCLANVTHRKSKTSEFLAWREIKYRCNTKTAKAYPYYGGRGITVCERWMNSFENFLTDMGTKPSTSHSIDRIDNSKGYSPENCRWATKREQISNRRNALKVEAFGIIMSPTDWAKVIKMNASTLKNALYRGVTVEYYAEQHLFRK